MKKFIAFIALFSLLALPSVALAGAAKLVFDSEAIVASGTAWSEIVDVSRGTDGYFTLIMRVVSATSHREVQVDAYISADGTNFVLDNQLVADWSNDTYVADTDAWQKVGGEDGITLGKAMQVKFLITGLTGASATVDAYFVK